MPLKTGGGVGFCTSTLRGRVGALGVAGYPTGLVQLVLGSVMPTTGKAHESLTRSGPNSASEFLAQPRCLGM